MDKSKRLSFAAIAKQAKQQQQQLRQEKEQQQPEQQHMLEKTNKNGTLNDIFEVSFDVEHDKPCRLMSFSRMDSYCKTGRPAVENNNSITPSKRSEGLSMSARKSAVRLALKDRMRKIAEERLTVMQIFSRYVDHSTLHGFRYTCSDTYFIRRFIWAVLMILGAIYFLVKLKVGIVEYFEYPFSTLSTVDFVDRLEFPAITFCPMNSFKIKQVEQNKLKQLYEQHRLPFGRSWQEPDFDIPGDELVELMRNSTVQIEDIFVSCVWRKRDTNHPDIDPHVCEPSNFTSFFNDNGQTCFTINSGKEGYRLLDIDHEGLNYGFELLLDLEVDEVYKAFDFTGIQVVIHHQSEPPVLNQGFSVAPGFKTFVQMNAVETTNLPPPYATECGEKKLKYHDTYTQKACLLELLTDYTGEKCDCREPFMPDNKLPYCSLKETIICMFPAKESFDEYEMRQKCPIDCEITSYTTRLSDARYIHDPPKGVEKQILKQEAEQHGVNETHLMELASKLSTDELDHYIQNNMINVVFFYNEMKKELLEQEASFDFYQFLGDMGGEIGLMLGASLLTFVEFVDLIIFLIYHQLLRLHKQKKHQEIDEDNTYEAFEYEDED